MGQSADGYLSCLALGMEEGDEDLMRRPPRPRSEGLFANGLHMQIIFRAVLLH